MNSVKSVYYGWATFIAAGGLAYMLAKRSISQDRAKKALEDIEWRKQQIKLKENEEHYRAFLADKNGAKVLNGADSDGLNPSIEAGRDPAPTRHAPVTEGQKTLEKSKYEATEVWRSPKGDRLR